MEEGKEHKVYRHSFLTAYWPTRLNPKERGPSAKLKTPLELVPSMEKLRMQCEADTKSLVKHKRATVKKEENNLEKADQIKHPERKATIVNSFGPKPKTREEATTQMINLTNLLREKISPKKATTPPQEEDANEKNKKESKKENEKGEKEDKS